MPLLHLYSTPDVERRQPHRRGEGSDRHRADSIAAPVAFGQLQLLTGRPSVGVYEPGMPSGMPGSAFP